MNGFYQKTLVNQQGNDNKTQKLVELQNSLD